MNWPWRELGRSACRTGPRRKISSRARLTLDSPTSRSEADRLDLTSRGGATRPPTGVAGVGGGGGGGGPPPTPTTKTTQLTSDSTMAGMIRHMHAVLIEVDVAGVDREQGINALREHVVPAIKSLPGFHSGTWLSGGTDGKGLSLTLWDSEDSARVMAERFGPGSSPTASASVVRCEVREVAALA
jgi:hypothetical protein